ncbi:HAMP domain-containing sensor histidine kinase [Vagococcus elongatus]|uniref:histidine kinase n=1 Tax=Vagococcus elongatus TaxID=180344 RepID=A0A430B4L3_9ENTE|nr:HAMP domain-containing sensor histidine kinase [Vagococcus elongatus]RSU15265.1 hypothetical protein CBF29_02725 [Vagococcus elongatus]
MKINLKTYILLSFLAILILLIGSLGAVTFYLSDKHFDDYVAEKYQDKLTDYAAEIELTFDTQTAVWSEEDLLTLSQQMNKEDLQFIVYDAEDVVIWNSSTDRGNGHMNGSGHNKRLHGSPNHGMSKLDETAENFREQQLSLSSNDTPIGSVLFQYYEDSLYNEQDQKFAEDIKKSLVIIFVLSLPAAFLFAVFLAKHISRPIAHTTVLTQKMADGNFDERLGYKTRVTELNELTEALNKLSAILSQQEQYRKQMSTDIAHEIRTPLTTLQGSLEAMADGIWEITPERLLLCREEVTRLTRLVRDIDNMGELEKNEDTLIIERFNFKDLVSKVATNFSHKFIEKKIDFQMIGPDVQIEGDQDKLQQVLTNLMANSLNFSKKNGKIICQWQIKKDDLIITFADEGMGIPENDLPRIFERLYRSDVSRSRDSGGQGVGLYIVKSIVTAHQGEIAVQSQLGKGTKFTITLPLRHI